MFRRLQLLPAMLLILAELIAVSASSSLSLSAAAGGGITDFAMPGMLPPFETSGCSACVLSWSCVILSYSLLNIAETQPTCKMIATLRLCLYLRLAWPASCLTWIVYGSFAVWCLTLAILLRRFYRGRRLPLTLDAAAPTVMDAARLVIHNR